MSDILQDFLTRTRQNLAHLPPDERERRLDAISDQLARFVAVRLEQGIEEETATAEAIGEFESPNRDALTADLPPKSRFGGNLSPIIVAAFYCAVANKAIALLIGTLFQWVAGWSLPSFAGFGIQMLVSPAPSLLLATLAAGVLVLREGFPKIASTLSSPRTVEGNGARWTALNQGIIFLLGLGIVLLLRSGAAIASGTLSFSTLEKSPLLGIVVLVVLLLMLAAPFAAGWIVARAVPRAGLAGVQIAAVTSALLSFADQCLFLRDATDGAPLLPRVIVFLMALLGQAILVALAILGAYLGSHDTPKSR